MDEARKQKLAICGGLIVLGLVLWLLGGGAGGEGGQMADLGGLAMLAGALIGFVHLIRR